MTNLKNTFFQHFDYRVFFTEVMDMRQHAGMPNTWINHKTGIVCELAGNRVTVNNDLNVPIPQTLADLMAFAIFVKVYIEPKH